MGAISSSGAGSWDASATWDGGVVPTIADDITILHTVDISAGVVAEVLSLVITSNTLTLDASASLRFEDSADATFLIEAGGELAVVGLTGQTCTISSITSSPTNYYKFTNSGTVAMDFCDFKDIADFENAGSMETSHCTTEWHPTLSYVLNSGTFTIENSTFTTSGSLYYILTSGTLITDDYTTFEYVQWTLQSDTYTFIFEDYPFSIRGHNTSNKRIILTPVIGGTVPRKYVTGREGRRIVIRGSFQSANATLIKDLKVMNEDQDEVFRFIFDEGVIHDVVILELEAPRAAQDVGEKRYVITLQEVYQ